jgi:membrane-associated phospholipid phosphatase
MYIDREHPDRKNGTDIPRTVVDMSAQGCNRFYPEETATVLMLLLLNTAMLLFTDISSTVGLFILNLAAVAAIVAFSFVPSDASDRNGILSFIRDWYILAFLIFLYLQSGRLVPLVNPHDVDSFIIRIDRFFFFGHDPTVLVERFIHPVLTELFQIVYASFYLLPLILCVLLYRRDSRREFHTAAALIVLGFYISYIGYYITPAVGPRFTLDHLQSVPLLGTFFFDYLRALLDVSNTPFRDCCPSGHTMISLLTIMLAHRFKKSFFTPALLWALLLICSTVYLRYHYVWDLAVGAILALVLFHFLPRVEAAVERSMSYQRSRS